jgi:SOS response regulatory protein OraA/RecX
MPRIIKLIPRRKGQWLELVPDAGESLRLPLHAMPGGLEPGVVVSDAQWQALGREAAFHAVHDRALRILGLREHFTRELEGKLFTRTRDGAAVHRALDALRERGYLDDQRAAQYVAEFITRRGAVGPRLLKAELLRRGCPPELVGELVARHAAEQAEEDSLGKLLAGKRSAWERKAQQLRRKLEAKELTPRQLAAQLRAQFGASVLAWLAARGFDGEEARSRARQLVEELL